MTTDVEPRFKMFKVEVLELYEALDYLGKPVPQEIREGLCRLAKLPKAPGPNTHFSIEKIMVPGHKSPVKKPTVVFAVETEWLKVTREAAKAKKVRADAADVRRANLEKARAAKAAKKAAAEGGVRVSEHNVPPLEACLDVDPSRPEIPATNPRVVQAVRTHDPDKSTT